MTAEILRHIIVEQKKPQCEGEAKAHAVANNLGGMQWWIFEGETPEDQKAALEAYGYDDINKLRGDAADLISSLRSELTPEDWETYFGEIFRPSNEIIPVS